MNKHKLVWLTLIQQYDPGAVTQHNTPHDLVRVRRMRQNPLQFHLTDPGQTMKLPSAILTGQPN